MNEWREEEGLALRTTGTLAQMAPERENVLLEASLANGNPGAWCISLVPLLAGGSVCFNANADTASGGAVRVFSSMTSAWCQPARLLPIGNNKRGVCRQLEGGGRHRAASLWVPSSC